MMTMMPYYTRTLRNRNAAPARYVSPFGEEFFRSFFGESAVPSMKVDVEDKGNEYLLKTDLPGVKKEEVSISIEDGMLTITVEQNAEKNEEDKEKTYLLRERRSVNMSRSFSLEGVNEEGVAAEYADGVLHLTLPKAVQPEEKVRRIEIK